MAVAGVAALAADGSFEDVRDGMLRIEDFFLGSSEGTSFPGSAASCDCAVELSGADSGMVVASWTVSVVAHQYKAWSSQVDGILIISTAR